MVDRLNALITEMYEITKVEAGKLNFFYQLFDFDKMVKNVVEVLGESDYSRDIILSGSTGAKIQSDKNKIEQVLINYISNAIKYSPGSSQVEVHLDKEDDNVIVSVKDFGIGIPEDFQNQIFQKFYRAKNTGKIEGLGLGLFLSKKIIEGLGGAVWFKSQLGQGTIFYFSLPISPT
jgi:signal transduction histidine kinase